MLIEIVIVIAICVIGALVIGSLDNKGRKTRNHYLRKWSGEKHGS